MKKENVIERLMSSYTLSESGCWVWNGTSKNRYPLIRVGKKIYLLHRLVYQLLVGEIPKDGCILHKCDNTRCMNPEHLFLGTHADNAKDKVKKGRARFAPGPENVSDYVHEIVIKDKRLRINEEVYLELHKIKEEYNLSSLLDALLFMSTDELPLQSIPKATSSGHPRSETPMMLLTVRLPVALHNAILDIQKEDGKNQSEVIRDLLYHGIIHRVSS